MSRRGGNWVGQSSVEFHIRMNRSEVRRAAGRLHMEVEELSFHHFRVGDFDVWPGSHKFWNRISGERGEYENLYQLLKAKADLP